MTNQKEPLRLSCKCGANQWEYYGKEIVNHMTKYSVMCLWCGQEYMIRFIHTQPHEVIGS